MPEAATAPGDTALGISFKSVLHDTRELVFQTHVPLDMAPEALNNVLDKLHKAAERQQAKVLLPPLRENLERNKTLLTRMLEDRNNLDEKGRAKHTAEGRRSDYKRSATDQTHYDNSVITEGRYREEIERFEKAIADQEAKLKE